MDLLIEMADVALGYGRRRILSGLNLRIQRGDFWCVLGPNGEGKSTLLRAALGLLPTQAGRLWRHPDCERFDQTGFVPQRSDFNPALPTTVREFVSLGLAGLRITRADEADRLARSLEQVGLAALRQQAYATLSGGQRQRALLARALIRRPSLLVLDEPTNGLDLAAEEGLMDVLQRLHDEEHLTILFVTHDLPLALRHATHLALLHGGGAEGGATADLLARDALSRAYGIPLDHRGERRTP